jgi:hypothetical protein
MPDVTSRPFSELFGGRPGDGSLESLARAAARAGYAVLPIAPGEKHPLCVLTDRQRQQADKKAAQEARDVGKRNWERVRHPCGICHSTTDEKEAHRWFKRLAEEHPGLNLAVDVNRSRALVVDADTAAELASFTTLWARKEGVEDLIHAAPTVRSPGDRDEHGAWKHSEGGHYWFLLPEGVDLGDLAGVTSIPIGTDPEHPAQLKVAGYVLVPPSVRSEGEYRMASDAHVAPGWLIDLVVGHLTGRRETRAERRDRALDADDHIRLAQSLIPWASVLVSRGWVDSGKSSRCGCPEWTAPGDHTSTKSATAHDPGCAEFDTADGFIHIWTDNPPGGLAAAGAKTFSKIQFVAWHDHGGDVAEAMADLGIERTGSGQPTVLDRERVAELLATSKNGSSTAADTSDDTDDGGDADPEPEDTDIDQVDALIAELIPASDLDKIPPPVPLVEGLLDRNSLARVIGKPGHGKSFFMIDISGHVALGKPWHGRACSQGDVVYMVAEGASGMHKRIRAWELHNKAQLGARVKFLPRPVQVKDHEWLVWVAAMAKLRPSMIIIDTQARVTAGANENGSEDMGLLVQRAELLRQQTGACVVLVHHKGHQGDHGRGHSMVIGALDAEIEVTKEGRNKIAVMSSKQKDQEDFDPIRLELAKVRIDIGTKGSAVLVAPGEEGADPFVEAEPVVDEQSPARDRLVKWIYQGFNHGRGGTKGEIRAYVSERDRGAKGKPMSRASFFEAWGRLEKDQVLVPEAKSRFKVSTTEARRLGLENDA